VHATLSHTYSRARTVSSQFSSSARKRRLIQRFQRELHTSVATARPLGTADLAGGPSASAAFWSSSSSSGTRNEVAE
jgi:hypothetical protein